MGQSACDQGGLDCRDGVVWVVGVVRMVRVVGLVRKVEVVSFNFKIPCSASNFRHFHSAPIHFGSGLLTIYLAVSCVMLGQ